MPGNRELGKAAGIPGRCWLPIPGDCCSAGLSAPLPPLPVWLTDEATAVTPGQE